MLISQLTSGDPIAPRTFLDTYGPRMRAVLRRRFSVSGDVLDDLVQTAIMHFYENNWRVLRLWKGVGRLETYLAAVAVNRARDYLRSLRNRPFASGGEVDPAGEGDATGYALQQQVESLVERVLELLDARYSDCRRLLKLKYVHDFSYKEIAEIMDMTTNRVGVYLHRCLERCRTLLGHKNPLS